MAREHEDYSDIYSVSWNIDGVQDALGIDATSLHDRVLGSGYRLDVVIGGEQAHLDLYPDHGVVRLDRREVPLDFFGMQKPSIGPEGVTFERHYPHETVQLALNRERELALYIGPARRSEDPRSGRPDPLSPIPYVEPPMRAASPLSGTEVPTRLPQRPSSPQELKIEIER